MNTNSSSRLDALQLLRAVAAMLVLIDHILTESASHGASFAYAQRLPWGAGVDLFFVISGFIMVYSSERLYGAEKARSIFWTKRLIRIVPLYWVCTAIMLLTLAARAAMASKAFPSLTAIATSYAFVPYDGYGTHDGFGFPVYTLGWTLNYEMFFYLIFGLFIAFARDLAVSAVAGVLVVIVILGQLFGPLPLPLHFWSRPIVLEFVLGMGIALLWRRDIELPRIARYFLIAAAIAVFVFAVHVTPNGFSRAIVWGGSAAALLSAMALGSTQLSRWIAIPGVMLGDASYSLYLTHPFCITVFHKLWPDRWTDLSYGMFGALLIPIILSCAVAILTYRYFERPVMRFATRRFVPSSRLAAAATPVITDTGVEGMNLETAKAERVE